VDDYETFALVSTVLFSFWDILATFSRSREKRNRLRPQNQLISGLVIVSKITQFIHSPSAPQKVL
jgi:hypothetical protein